jgi:hypothetical protein
MSTQVQLQKNTVKRRISATSPVYIPLIMNIVLGCILAAITLIDKPVVAFKKLEPGTSR